MPVAGQLTQLTENVEIYLTPTGSNLVDNFNIDIYKWDTGSVSEVLSGSYATGVTPTTLSAYNNHSLVDGYPDGGSGFGYGISGITFDCTKVRLTTSGSFGHCMGGTSDADLTHAASKIYNPSSGNWTASYYDTSTKYNLYYQNVPNQDKTDGRLVADLGDVAYVTTIPWSKVGSPYELYDLATYFTLSHVTSKRVSNNATITGSLASGPLQTLSIGVETGFADEQHFYIRGYQIPNITQKIPYDTVVTKYRLTWTDSGNYHDFDFYWSTDSGNV